MLADNVKARIMTSDGTYKKKERKGEAVNAQAAYESYVECTPSEDASESKKGKKINLSESIQRIWKKE